MKRLRVLTLVLCSIALAWPALYADAPLLSPSDGATSEVSFADFNGDGRADMAVRELYTKNIRIYLNNGNRFAASPSWQVPRGVESPDWEARFADFNGDGRADLINRYPGNGFFCVHINSGTDFPPTGPCPNGMDYQVGGASWRTLFAPVDGDSRAELININATSGDVYVHRNNGGGFDTPAYIAQSGLAVPFGGAAGWEPMLADCDGDGRSDFFNLAQIDGHFHCHLNQGGSSFGTSYNRHFFGPPEIYERQMFLADLDGDHVADVISHDLRHGDVVGYRLFNASGEAPVGHVALLRDRTDPYMRRTAQWPLVENYSRSLSALVWYEADHIPGDPPRGPNGWWNLYPGAPGGTVPNDNQWYRTDTPLLGTYPSADTGAVKQHAYWMRALGADALVVDWTNCRPGENEWFCDSIHANIVSILSTLSGIREFLPPRVTVAMRIFDSNYAEATAIANDVYEMYQSNPDMWLKYNDGSTSKDKPVLIVFSDFTPEWQNGPQWGDSRFNVRFTNGYLYSRQGFTSLENDDRSYVTNDLPYWAFVENAPHPTRSGYYRSVYRRLPTNTAESEQSDIWSSLWRASGWDGQFDVVDGKNVIERTADPLLSKPPRNVIVGRFNYMTANYINWQEGLSTNGSTYIEPSQFTQWSVFNKTASVLFDLKKQRKAAPGAPIVTDYNGSQIKFQSANYPTEYCVSSNSTCSGGTWNFVDVRGGFMASGPAPFYLLTRNPFGTSSAVWFPG